MIDTTVYQSPLQSRYASREMSHLFSPQFKSKTWRKLWLALAKAQKKVGVPISAEQIEEMEKHLDIIDFEKIKVYEKQCRHEVMAHIHAFGDQCPNAKKIIHLGATSSYVMDNTVLIQMKEGLSILTSKLHLILGEMEKFARRHADTPCLAYTHFQPAQPTTVGKRTCSWLQDFLFDLTDLKRLHADLKFLGVKGATGTQSSFLSLLDNDEKRVKALEEHVCKEMGFTACFAIATQTYPRKVDMQILAALAGIGASAHKMGGDLRLLAHLGEVCEPFEKRQVGSSAMPYKRNPILAERICSLARYIISHFENAAYNASLQWLERTLDDSANRRLTIAEAFLCADAILNLTYKVMSELHTFPKIMRKNLDRELPFLALETLLMLSVEKGNDRQQVHEKLRRYSTLARTHEQEEGTLPDFLAEISNDPSIGLSKEEIEKAIRVDHFIGLAPKQTLDFLNCEVVPILDKTVKKTDFSLDVEV